VNNRVTSPDLIDRLVAHKTLGAAPREELAWVASHGTLENIELGEVVSSRDRPVMSLFIVLAGHIAIFVDGPSGRRRTLEWRAGDVAGVLPYSRLVNPPGDAVALEPSEVFVVPREEFPALTRECQEVTALLVHKMLDRARVFTSTSLQDERLLSLGKLSAGLAHELNNPTAAIERSASLLDDRLDDAEQAVRELAGTRLSAEELAAIDSVRTACLVPPAAGTLSPIQQAEREDDITDWLTARGVDPAAAVPLAETAVTIEALDRIAASIAAPHLGAVLRWVAAGCSIRGLASEIQEAATRISGLVTAIKGFTHMDQAPVAEVVDLEASLGNTATVLKAKARAKGIAVTVRAAPGLPRIRGFIGELNQIWANLIDNALDAAPDAGRVDVTATREGQHVVVRVIDNGPGVPAEIRSRIFDPFFTTKPVGRGTGLGLDIVRRLLQHNDATIEIDSVPGRTEFRVLLPIAEPDDGSRPS
jgi:signal transduction histidine kinase